SAADGYLPLEGAPYAIPYGTPDGTKIAGPTTYFTTMAQFVPGVVPLGNHRDFAGFYGPEARISIMEARERGGAGAQGAYEYLWPFIGHDLVPCETPLGLTSEPYLACRAGFALDPYPACSSLATSSLSTTQASVAGSVNVKATTSACTWTAESNNDWISVTSGASGVGVGTVGYSIAANVGPARVGS